MVRLLVDHGAERDATDNDGRTADDIARSLGHAEIADYLSGEEPLEQGGS
jgi:ankyrin repeat protein